MDSAWVSVKICDRFLVMRRSTGCYPFFSSLGDGCSFPTCLVNQDPEQPSTPAGLNSSSKNPENHQFPAKPLRESQSHLLTDSQSWTESSTNPGKGKSGMSNPALTMENET